MLKELVQAIAEPRKTIDYRAIFSIAYAIAKAVLNTGDFSHLLEQPTARSLHDEMSGAIPAERIERRFDVVVRTARELLHPSDGRYQAFSPSALYPLLMRALAEHGLHHEPLWDTATLSARSVCWESAWPASPRAFSIATWKIAILAGKGGLGSILIRGFSMRMEHSGHLQPCSRYAVCWMSGLACTNVSENIDVFRAVV
jgi:hypothetical protein